MTRTFVRRGMQGSHPAPGIAVYHIRMDDYVVMAAEHDLARPLLDLVTAVMALGSEYYARDAGLNWAATCVVAAASDYDAE
jgi:hypothetical protein